MRAPHALLAVAVAALVAVSPVIGGAEGTATPAPDAAARSDADRAHSNSPHPAVLSFERPVYQIGVPNPPVSLERY
jgi:hypothetical protein